MKFVEVVDLELYMKSGNVIKVDSVSAETKIIGCSTGVAKISEFKQIRPKRTFNLVALDLNQIESIVYTNSRSKMVF